MKRRKRAGSAILEFGLVGVPVIFLIISVFEMSMTMWQYHTLAEAVQVAGRYVATHGSTCNCSVTVSNIATVVKNSAIGLPAAGINLKLTSGSGTVISCTVAACISGGSAATQFPPSGTDSAEGAKVTISATFVITNPLVMYWPGGNTISGSNYTLGAQSIQEVLY